MALPAPRSRPPLQQQRSSSFTSSPVSALKPRATLPFQHGASASTDAAYAEDAGVLDAMSDEEELDFPSGLELGASIAPLQPRSRPPLPLVTSSSSLRSLRGEAPTRAPPAVLPLSSSRPPQPPPPAEMSPAAAEAAPPAQKTPETPKEQPATPESLLNFVLGLRKTGTPPSAKGQPLSRTGSDQAVAMRRQESHSRNESNGSATSVEEEMERQRLPDMSRSASASSVPSTRGRSGPSRELTGLESVDLSHKRMADLPASVIQVLAGHVERLALGYNHLVGLPAELTQIGGQLRYLNVRVNNLTVFPAVLCELPSLEILDISRNKITKLPRAAGTLKNIKVLSLSKNRITKLPTWFAQLTALRVLKLDHNPISYPPREITTMPVGNSPPLQQGEDGDRKRSKVDDPTMVGWISRMQAWLLEHHVERRAPPLPLVMDGDTQSETDSPLTMARKPVPPPLHSPFGPSPPPLNGSDTPRAMRSRGGSSSAMSPSVSTPTPSSLPISSRMAASASSPATPLSFLDVEVPPKVVQHGRNASTSTADSSPFARPGLRSKKSLPDLRQSHAQILDDRAREAEVPRLTLNLAAARRPRADSMASPMAAAFPRPGAPLNQSTGYFEPRKPGGAEQSTVMSPQSTRTIELEKPRRATETESIAASVQSSEKRAAPSGGEGRGVGIDRNSGAYFRRLSMLPPSTISKAVPMALLQFVDAIRGILFALSQMHSALKQFVMFATPDRLPGALARMMSNAETSMSSLIDALDRFDGSTRRSMPTSSVVREVYEACRENVAAFGKLVGVLALQLKILTATADIRYTRTLLLMLYGSMAEIASAWGTLTPLADELRPVIKAEGDQRIGAALTLQPPTPSPKDGDTPLPAPGSFRPPPLGPPPVRPRGKSVGRRHAGSFSAEDLSTGASLPQHSPTSSIASSSVPPVLPPIMGAGMKSRPGAPKLAMSFSAPGGSSQPAPVIQDFLKHLNDMPPTPIAPMPPPSVHQAVLTATTPLPEPLSASMRPAPSTSSDNLVIDDFLDMVDSTTNVALSVCSMLTERTHVRRFSELNDLCEAGADLAKKLKADLTKLPGGSMAMSEDKRAEGSARWRAVSKMLSPVDCKKLWEDSNAFAKAVISIATLARAVSQEAAKANSEQPFADPAREGISQLAKSTNTLLSIAAVAVKPR